MQTSRYFCWIIFVIYLLPIEVFSEFFSSLGHLEQLVSAEELYLKKANDYIHQEESRLKQVEIFIKNTKKLNDIARADKSIFLSHPINQYKLIERFASNWKNIQSDHFTPNHSNNLLTDVFEYKSGHDDTIGAFDALMRLQSVYHIEPEQLIGGDIFGEKSLENLTSSDLYFIGTNAYGREEYSTGYKWLKILLERSNGTDTDFDSFKLRDFLAVCAARIGKLDEAVNLTRQLLEEQPTNERLQQNLYVYENKPENVKKQSPKHEYFRSKEFLRYESVCRGSTNDLKQTDLQCYFYTNNKNPYLILRPLKLEEIARPTASTPHLVRFYNFVSDYEMEVVKQLATPQLGRATVHNSKTGKLEHADYRVSKSAWLKKESHKVVKDIVERIAHVTNLTLDTSEVLQVANYGMGGQYEPHHDYSLPHNVRKEIGNRIATMLIYMSDIGYGGGTAFLYPGVAVQPIKGSSVFWYNLLPSGEADVTTRHAACPVLTGIKWVANQWIRERGQEFIRKCDLDRRSLGSIL